MNDLAQWGALLILALSQVIFGCVLLHLLRNRA